MNIIKLKKNMILFKYQEKTDQPNVLYITGKKIAVLIDAGPSIKFAHQVLKYLSEHQLQAPTYIIITHYHWDHSFGICGYNALAICSSYTNERLKSFMKLDFKKDNFISDELINEFSVNHLKLEYPSLDIQLREGDLIVDDLLKLDLGDFIMEIRPIVSSHTEGSLIVLAENLLFLGDASCGKIIGKEFVEDKLKLTSFIQEIKTIPCEYVLEGHSNIVKKEIFIQEIEAALNNKYN